MGCTKQNGDAARKGCIAVLLVWFDLLVLRPGSASARGSACSDRIGCTSVAGLLGLLDYACLSGSSSFFAFVPARQAVA